EDGRNLRFERLGHVVQHFFRREGADGREAHKNPCGGYGRDRYYGKGYYRPKYRHASYKGHRRRRGYYLSYGSRGHKVSKLQHQLGMMGYFHHHRATGYFGPKTKRAVKAFQRDHGLRPDGIVGRRTREVLGFF
ncbi:MAG: peptidoglycan-binding protein, partial [Okeania sp. SIO3B3]|nr:peptidoglycan-binding protein [Okeania sp. SIO3B3]